MCKIVHGSLYLKYCSRYLPLATIFVTVEHLRIIFIGEAFEIISYLYDFLLSSLDICIEYDVNGNFNNWDSSLLYLFDANVIICTPWMIYLRIVIT
jgi:hypothetical protein